MGQKVARINPEGDRFPVVLRVVGNPAMDLPVTSHLQASPEGARIV
jgi:hypothetical protein